MITVLNDTLKNKGCGVYSILNSINGKIYVGSAIILHRRLVDHIYFLNLGKHHSILLQRAWNKYGEEAFSFYVLEYCNKDQVVDREQYWIDLTNCADPECGYNISPTAGNCLGVRHSEEVKLARSKRLKGIKRSDEAKTNMSVARKGLKIHSEASKLKISLAGKARIISEATKLKLSAAGKGRKHSPETIELLKAKAKLRGNNNRLGSKYSEQAKKNMSEAQKKRYSENNQWK